MDFTVPDLSLIRNKLSALTTEKTPVWGEMSAQRMVEHLSESVQISYKPHDFPLTVPEEKLPKALAFLESEHPMPKNFRVAFNSPGTPNRLESLEAAIEELSTIWQEAEDWWKRNPDAQTLHPSFGMLDRNQWQRVHAKHFDHHFEQFGL